VARRKENLAFQRSLFVFFFFSRARPQSLAAWAAPPRLECPGLRDLGAAHIPFRDFKRCENGK